MHRPLSTGRRLAVLLSLLACAGVGAVACGSDSEGPLAGVFAFTYSGDRSGRVAFELFEDGAMDGAGFDDSLGAFTVAGRLSGAQFRLDVSVAGDETGAAFSGLIDATLVTGTWRDPAADAGGTFSGTPIPER